MEGKKRTGREAVTRARTGGRENGVKGQREKTGKDEIERKGRENLNGIGGRAEGRKGWKWERKKKKKEEK